MPPKNKGKKKRPPSEVDGSDEAGVETSGHSTSAKPQPKHVKLGKKKDTGRGPGVSISAKAKQTKQASQSHPTSAFALPATEPEYNPDAGPPDSTCTANSTGAPAVPQLCAVPAKNPWPRSPTLPHAHTHTPPPPPR